jgi:two-component system, OmpR family, phosphate regulon sensor histidine kinase PhoR
MWIYAAILCVLVGTILAIQVSWILQSARIEENFLNQRVNMALCSAMDVLSKDRGLCSNVSGCVSHGNGTFEIAFNAQDKQKIDSAIQHHLWFYNIHVPFETTLSPYMSDRGGDQLPLGQALLYPAKAGMQNVLVHIHIPSSSQLLNSQINGTFILSIVVLVFLTALFVSTLRGLHNERKIRSESVEFINTMAHDLKTPISNISLATSLLNADQKNLSTTSRQYISIIESETKRLKERARKILGLASVDAVLEETTAADDVDIHDLINHSVESFSFQIEQAKGTIHRQLAATRTIVKGNQIQLSSAITNIIDNAIIYSSAPFDIQIKTVNEGKGISIEIADKGPGIAPQEQALVFRKAYRARNGKSVAEGFGLGLYLAKTLVEKHGGRLSLSSDGNSGSSFLIKLPLLQ